MKTIVYCEKGRLHALELIPKASSSPKPSLPFARTQTHLQQPCRQALSLL